jgi:phosphoribosylanthranilate isomerase
MTWIKICGTTNLEDALTAADAGADALGFVFYENSPRNIGRKAVREIVRRLPEGVEKIGVMPDASMEISRELAAECGLTGIQVYVPLALTSPGNKAIGQRTLKRIYVSFSVSDLVGDKPRINVDFSSFAKRPSGGPFVENPFDAIMLDSGTAQRPGGTGKQFDWQATASLVERIGKEGVKVIVAGGLNPSNVTEAIRILEPWGVDVVSGVEASPGKKDPEKVRAFITAVRAFEKRTQ